MLAASNKNTTNRNRNSMLCNVIRGRRMQEQILPVIANALQLIFRCNGYKLKLNNLLRYANTNITNVLGSESTSLCSKALLLESCVDTC